jgi:hypothetical protein
MKKKVILSLASKWMELKNIILRLARLTRPKIVCSLSYADFRSWANTAMWLDLGHVLREEHIREVWG